jgi:tetratricopeptide (TPR) repeat protein
MKSSIRIRLAAIAALAAVPAFLQPAHAQNRIDTSGRALDANNQVGSGGYNLQNNNPVANYQTYQNAIATNNIGNGFAFHGRTVGGYNLGVGYTDPFAFRGLLPGQGVDQFVANSSGVPTMANPSASSSKFAQSPNIGLTYYGAMNHSAPPPGYETGTYGFNYTPSEPVTQSPQDTRIGAINYSGTSETQIIPKPNELLLPGPVDTSANPPTQAQQLLAASPLYGMRSWQGAQNVQMSSTTNSAWQPGWSQTPLQQGFAPNLSTSLNQDRISEMQQELVNGSGSNSTTGGGSAATSNGAASFNSTQLQPLTPGGENSGFGQTLPPVLSNDSQLPANNLTPQAGDVSTSQSNRQYLSPAALPPPGLQSAQYALLQQQYQAYTGTHNMTDQEANQRFQQILKLRDIANKNAEQGGNVFSPAAPTPAANPNVVPGPDQPAIPPLKPSLHAGPAQANPKDQLKPGFTTMPSNLGGFGVAAAPPVAIDSYATGIKAKGLANLISSAESMVQKQQYDKAIGTFNEAIDVAPNNPMILLARANAELGGGYFAQANADLHLSIAQDPAILMGQYDLQKHLGPERLKSLISDLKEISQASKDDAMHAFLLAYVYYNSHHVGQAADWLAIADHRSNGEDPAIVQMKKSWNFNEDQQPVAAPSQQPVAVPSTRPSMTK